MLISWSRVQELRAEIGDESFAEVVAIFLEESDAVIARSQSGFTPEDLHFLKGAALNLGFSTLAAACDSGEDAAHIVGLYRSSKADLLAETG